MSKVNVDTRRQVEKRIRAVLSVRCMECNHQCNRDSEVAEIVDYLYQQISQTEVDAVRIAFESLAKGQNVQITKDVFEAIHNRQDDDA